MTKLKYIDSFASMEQKPERPRTTFNSHHRQGISLSTNRKTRIDFEKTCGMDLFCKGVPKRIGSAFALPILFGRGRRGEKPSSNRLRLESGSSPFQKIQVFRLGFFHLCPQDTTSFACLHATSFRAKREHHCHPRGTNERC